MHTFLTIASNYKQHATLKPCQTSIKKRYSPRKNFIGSDAPITHVNKLNLEDGEVEDNLENSLRKKISIDPFTVSGDMELIQ